VRLRRRLLLLEKALPAQEPAPAEDVAIDWETVCQALLSEGSEQGRAVARGARTAAARRRGVPLLLRDGGRVGRNDRRLRLRTVKGFGDEGEAGTAGRQGGLRWRRCFACPALTSFDVFEGEEESWPPPPICERCGRAEEARRRPGRARSRQHRRRRAVACLPNVPATRARVPVLPTRTATRGFAPCARRDVLSSSEEQPVAATSCSLSQSLC
jgi:hypothetical protein